jgi:hypothetical protein
LLRGETKEEKGSSPPSSSRPFSSHGFAMQIRTFEALIVLPQKHMFIISFCSAIRMLFSCFGSVCNLKVSLLFIATIMKNLNCSSKNLYSF